MAPLQIKLLCFITETLCVYCAVRDEYLNMIQVCMGLMRGHSVAKMFGRKVFHEFLASNVGNRWLASRSACLLMEKIALLLPR
jgi:hypothetical protein